MGLGKGGTWVGETKGRGGGKDQREDPCLRPPEASGVSVLRGFETSQPVPLSVMVLFR